MARVLHETEEKHPFSVENSVATALDEWGVHKAWLELSTKRKKPSVFGLKLR